MNYELLNEFFFFFAWNICILLKNINGVLSHTINAFSNHGLAAETTFQPVIMISHGNL